jgi:hypothetical protein
MKPRIYILSILFVLSMFFTLQARAEDHGFSNNNNNSKDCGNSNSTALPIDSGIAFLVIAGTAIGIFAVKKSRSSKMVAIKS